MWLPRTVSGAPCLEKERSSEQGAGDAHGQHGHWQGQLRALPCPSWQNWSQRWVGTDGCKTVAVPGTPSSHHISVSPSLRFPHLQSSPPTGPLSCVHHPLGPRNLSEWSFLGTCDGSWVLLKNLAVSANCSLWLFCVWPVSRSAVNTEHAEYLVMEFLCLQYLNCWFVCPFKPPNYPTTLSLSHRPSLPSLRAGLFSLHLRQGEYLQTTALLKAGTSPLHQCQSSCWEWHCGSLEPSSIPGKDLISHFIISLMLSLISYNESCPCPWWN